MSRFTKIAVTVPTATHDAVERVRRRLGQSRSAVVARALEEWLRGLDASEADRRYVEGYLRQPENLGEIEAVTAVATSHWSTWEPGRPSRTAEPTPRSRGKRG